MRPLRSVPAAAQRAALAPLALAAALLGVGGCAGPAGAAELDRGELRLELVGQLRSLFTFTRRSETERLFPGTTPGGLPRPASARRTDAGLLTERLRLTAEGRWRDRVSGQLVYDNEAVFGSGLDTADFQLSRRVDAGTWLDAERRISDHRRAHWRHRLYRAWLRYEADAFEVTLGRQRIALGRGRLWNPTDLFNPIPPLAIEGDQRIGQDAAVVRARLRPELWAMGIWSPQDDPDDHRAALRLEWSRVELDASLLVGRVRRDWVFGADFASDFFDATLRGEATFTDLYRHGRIWQAVLSLDYTFGIGTGLYAGIEHFYNENLVPLDGAAVVPPGLSPAQGLRLLESTLPDTSRLISAVKHQTALQAGYDLTPLWRLDVLWIHDWKGPSEAVVPTLRWSPRGNLELVLGAQLFAGQAGESQYGDVPNLIFAQLDWYF